MCSFLADNPAVAVADSEDATRTGFLQEDPAAIREVRRWVVAVARRNWRRKVKGGRAR